MKEDKFILVAVKGKVHKPIAEGIIKIIQDTKKKFSSSGNWKGWILQVRTPAGYKAKPILEKK